MRRQVIAVAILPLLLAGCIKSGHSDQASAPTDIPTSSNSAPPKKEEPSNKPKTVACDLLSDEMFSRLAGSTITSYEPTDSSPHPVRACVGFPQNRMNYAMTRLSCPPDSLIEYEGKTSPMTRPSPEPLNGQTPSGVFFDIEGGRVYTRTPDACIIEIMLGMGHDTADRGLLDEALKQAYDTEVAFGKAPL